MRFDGEKMNNTSKTEEKYINISPHMDAGTSHGTEDRI